MAVVWRGAGLITLCCYFLTLIAINSEVLLHYTRSRFDDVNFWLPALLTALFNIWWADYVHRMKGKENPQTYVGRLFLYMGRRHEIFWIPLPYWTIILLVLGLGGFVQKAFP